MDNVIWAGTSIHTTIQGDRYGNLGWNRRIQGHFGLRIHREWTEFHRKVPNTRKGFAEILKEVPATAHFVMEATGTYYLNLALYLHEQGLYVAVVNPFRIKSRMKSDMRRTKTDKADAYSILSSAKNGRHHAATKTPSLRQDDAL
jgi:transposase